LKVVINSIEKEFNENMTLKEVILQLQIIDKVMAAAVNMEIVKKDDWDSFILKENDEIELLQFVGGG
jgi:sulfur carrier protein